MDGKFQVGLFHKRGLIFLSIKEILHLKTIIVYSAIGAESLRIATASNTLTVCKFIKKRPHPTQVFSCEYCEIFKNGFFYRTYPVVLSDE